MAYSGTHLVNGIASSASACVMGFDQVGFMMGSSANIFNVLLCGLLSGLFVTFLLAGCRRAEWQFHRFRRPEWRGRWNAVPLRSTVIEGAITFL